MPIESMPAMNGSAVDIMTLLINSVAETVRGGALNLVMMMMKMVQKDHLSISHSGPS